MKRQISFLQRGAKLVFIVCVCLFFITPVVKAQKTVSIIADWHKGEKAHFVVEKIKSQNETTNMSSFDIYFEVVDSTADGYRIKLIYDNVLQEDLIPDSLREKAKEVFSTLDLDQIVYYRTTPTGLFVELENWQELRDQNFNNAKKLMQAMGQDDNESLDEILEVTKKLYEREDMVVGKLYSEIAYIHQFLGYEMKLNKTAKGKSVMPTAFGDVPAQTTLTVDEFDPETQKCRLTQINAINPKEMKKILNQYFKLLSSSMGVTMSKNAFAGIRLDIKDVIHAEYIAFPGMPLYIENERSVHAVADGAQSFDIERCVIRKVE